MAHSGKVYPVHFRRDLNINSTTNNTGFAKAYGLISENGQGVVGANLAGKRWICIAQQETTYPGLLYESEYQRVNGRDIKFTLVGDVLTWNANPAMLGTLTDRVAGLLAQFGNGYGVTGRYGSGTGSYRFSPLPRPDLFSVFSPTVVSTNAVLWEEWNNL